MSLKIWPATEANCIEYPTWWDDTKQHFWPDLKKSWWTFIEVCKEIGLALFKLAGWISYNMLDAVFRFHKC